MRRRAFQALVGPTSSPVRDFTRPFAVQAGPGGHPGIPPDAPGEPAGLRDRIGARVLRHVGRTGYAIPPSEEEDSAPESEAVPVAENPYRTENLAMKAAREKVSAVPIGNGGAKGSLKEGLDRHGITPNGVVTPYGQAASGILMLLRGGEATAPDMQLPDFEGNPPFALETPKSAQMTVARRLGRMDGVAPQLMMMHASNCFVVVQQGSLNLFNSVSAAETGHPVHVLGARLAEFVGQKWEYMPMRMRSSIRTFAQGIRSGSIHIEIDLADAVAELFRSEFERVRSTSENDTDAFVETIRQFGGACAASFASVTAASKTTRSLAGELPGIEPLGMFGTRLPELMFDEDGLSTIKEMRDQVVMEALTQSSIVLGTEVRELSELDGTVVSRSYFEGMRTFAPQVEQAREIAEGTKDKASEIVHDVVDVLENSL